jgi:hypothetical protein
VVAAELGYGRPPAWLALLSGCDEMCDDDLMSDVKFDTG